MDYDKENEERDAAWYDNQQMHMDQQQHKIWDEEREYGYCLERCDELIGQIGQHCMGDGTESMVIRLSQQMGEIRDKAKRAYDNQQAELREQKQVLYRMETEAKETI